MVNINRRSSSVDRRRSRTRHNSVTSLDSQAFVEGNEMFSGAASEVIPSSISSLHYPHNFGSVRNENSPLLAAYGDSNDLDLHSIRSNVSSNSMDSQVNFRFFSPDEIEHAHGGSTLENRLDPVDYNTNWDYSVDKYDDDVVLPFGPRTNLRRTSVRSFQLSESNASDSAFLDEYPSNLKYQRFYLAEEDLVIGIAGYTNCLWKKIIFWIICIGTFGLGYLILRWFPKYRVNLMGNSTTLGKAEWCVIETQFGELSIVPIREMKLSERLSSFLPGTYEDEDPAKDPVVPLLHSFKFRYINFFYSPVEDIFKTNSNWVDSHWLNIRNTKEGISHKTHEQRRQIFDANSIEIDEKTILQLLVDEVLHPFYIFQVFSIFLWLADEYVYYALCIFLISMISIINSLIETKSTIKRLQEISKFSCDVRVWRNGFWKQIDSQELVPGDVFEVDPSLSIVPCDALLLNGECVINESMLTGESVPVTKSIATQETVQALPENFVSPLLSKSFLYNGTKLLKMRTINDEPVTAMAVKTGFSTTKGSLIRSMLFPKPTDFKFYNDSFKYIGFMAIIAFFGFCYSTYNFLQLGLSKKLIILRALDIITIVVPPALPATLTIGSTFAVNRLKKLQIFCISPTKVNIGGKLDIMCFDKTGTLTEDGLDVLGVHVANNAPGRRGFVFGELSTSILDQRQTGSHDSNNEKFFLGGMACCHSLRLIENELLGDPLDAKLFEFTGWKFKEDSTTSTVYSDSNKYSIVREYEFISSLRRMTVVAQSNNQEYVFAKGAPEVMSEICLPESLPQNFDELLYHYTHRGFRVIACAYKSIAKNHLVTREAIESELIFTGFIIFENKLKESTKSTLQTLNRAEIRTVMCTGDNILTAISVARECELIQPWIKHIYTPSFMVNEFSTTLEWLEINNSEDKLDPYTLKPVAGLDDYRLAISGDVFRYLLTELKDLHIIHVVLMKCDIFARMSPDEKHELVEQLQEIEYTVGFCGDGANDCGALKAADVGISLSEAEASVAAPFTSQVFEISCVLDVIREGRSSLVTSFSCFKYMSLYSAIQFITVTILYKRGTNLGDFQFLYIDLFLILPLAIFMSWSKPFEKLAIKRPTANLVSPKVLYPLVSHIATLAAFQIFIWILVQKELWYIKPVPGGDDEVQSSDNSVLFLFSNLQYILIAVVLSSGPPYRQRMTKNHPFMINLVVAVILSLILFCVDANTWLGRLMQLTNLSFKFYVLMFVFAGLNLGVMIVGEGGVFAKLAVLHKRLFHRLNKSKKLFKNLRNEFSKVEVV